LYISVLQSRRRSPTLTGDFAFVIIIRHLRSLRLTHASKVGEHSFYMAFACCVSSRVEKKFHGNDALSVSK